MTRLFALLCLLTALEGRAQIIFMLEDSIAHWYGKLEVAPDDETRELASNNVRKFLELAFAEPESFNHPFDDLKFCKITSSDGRVRLFNWNVPYDDGSSYYFCYVLWRDPKTQVLSWQELNQVKREPDKIEQKFLSAEKWFGTLYYDVIPMGKKKKNDTYTLLGWQSKDNLTTRKVMDALTITGGQVRLGAPIFKTETGMQKRVIFEYSEQVSMSVKFHPKKKVIIIDHLAPSSPAMTGIYADYGPDGSYDAFSMVKGKWEYLPNIDLRGFSDKDDRPYTDPRED
ncbi:MAG: hypothetical protein JNM00_09290 [Flavobacteriales bacterium]|nr:hypothetical protein [Flavobacteriales bacterium]